jgi:outer membrane receptor protein involved in Fe transport
MLENLAMDVAGRLSNYSTSGTSKTWKIGFADDFGNGFNGRVDLSQDIRAPNINELFGPVSVSLSEHVDPIKKVAVLVTSLSGGNPNMQPEVGRTFTAGVSWSPQFVRNLSFAVDYFHIDISNIITSTGVGAILSRCAAGSAKFCARVTRDADGNLVSVSQQLLNLAEYKTDGADVDISYQRPAKLLGVAGRLRLRTLATWVHGLSTSDGETTINYVASLGGTGIGVPRWKGLMSLGFDSRLFSLHGRVRYISSADFDRNLNIVNNHIGNYYYVDGGASYKFGSQRKYRVFFDVTNITNKQVPHGTTGNFAAYYSAMGRYYTLVLRFSFGGNSG